MRFRCLIVVIVFIACQCSGFLKSARAEEIATQDSPPSQEWLQAFHDGCSTFGSKRFAEARDYFTKALAQAEQDKNLIEKANSLSWTGHTFLFEENFPEARQCHERVFDIVGRYGEPKLKFAAQGLALSLTDCAMMEYKERDYNLAEADIRHAIKIKTSALGEDSLAPNLATLGLILASKKEFKEAKAASDKSVKILQRTQAPDSPALEKYSELRGQVRGAAKEASIQSRRQHTTQIFRLGNIALKATLAVAYVGACGAAGYCNAIQNQPYYVTSDRQVYSPSSVVPSNFNTQLVQPATGITTAHQIGHYTFINGPNGTTTVQSLGNLTLFSGNGWNASTQRIGNFTFLNGPGAHSGSIQRIGNFTFGNFQ